MKIENFSNSSPLEDIVDVHAAYSRRVMIFRAAKYILMELKTAARDHPLVRIALYIKRTQQLNLTRKVLSE